MHGNQNHPTAYPKMTNAYLENGLCIFFYTKPMFGNNPTFLEGVYVYYESNVQLHFTEHCSLAVCTMKFMYNYVKH